MEIATLRRRLLLGTGMLAVALAAVTLSHRTADARTTSLTPSRLAITTFGHQLWDTWFYCPAVTPIVVLPSDAPAGSLEIARWRRLDAGTEPFPCRELDWGGSQSHIKFELPPAPIRTLNRAELRFRTLPPQTQRHADCNRLDLVIGSAPPDIEWPAGNFAIDDQLHPYAPAGTVQTRAASERQAVDVSPLVRAWVEGRSVNQGFLLSPDFAMPWSGIAPDTSMFRSCSFRYTDFSLYLDFEPAATPTPRPQFTLPTPSATFEIPLCAVLNTCGDPAPTPTPAPTATPAPKATPMPTPKPTPVPEGSMTIQGVVRFRGAPIAAGRTIQATVGGVVCGTATTTGTATMNFRITVQSAATMAGCGRAGDRVVLRVLGYGTAVPDVGFAPGATVTQDLSLG